MATDETHELLVAVHSETGEDAEGAWVRAVFHRITDDVLIGPSAHRVDGPLE